MGFSEGERRYFRFAAAGFTAVALGFVALGGIAVFKDGLSLRWPTVRGTVIASSVAESAATGARGAPRRGYRPSVRYSYEVNGGRYESAQMARYFARTYGSAAAAQEVVDRYPVGSSVTVYHEPGNPTEAALQPGFSGKPMIYFGVAALLLLVAVATLLAPRMLDVRG